MGVGGMSKRERERAEKRGRERDRVFSQQWLRAIQTKTEK